MKYQLWMVIGAHRLISNDFLTILAQSAAVMNSRPLSAFSNNPDDFFLPIVQQFGATVLYISNNQLKHFEQIQKMSQVFCKSWKQDYLNELQQRPN